MNNTQKIKVSRDLNKKRRKDWKNFFKQAEASHWYSINPTSSKVIDDNQINDIQEYKVKRNKNGRRLFEDKFQSITLILFLVKW